MSNCFRKKDGTLEREYLRVCGLYRLTRMRKLPKNIVRHLANKPFPGKRRDGWLDATIDIWFENPFKAWSQQEM